MVLWLVSFRSIGKVRSLSSVRQLCYNFWYFVCQLGKEDNEHSSKTSTDKDFDQDVTEVRSNWPFRGRTVFNNPLAGCFTQFFLSGQVPIGFRNGQNLQNIRYICQTYNQQAYYGTMFDLGRGIAVYSGYTLTRANVNFVPNRPSQRWRQIEGNYSLAKYKVRQWRSEIS